MQARGFSLHLRRRNVGYTLTFVPDKFVMRLTILGLLFSLLLPMNLFAQATPPPEVAIPTATPEPQKGKQSEIGPSLPFTGGGKGGATIPIEINSDSTRYEGGIAIADGNVVIRYGAVTIYCDYAEYDPDTHDIVLRGNVRFFQDRYAFVADRAIYNIQTKQIGRASCRERVSSPV